MAGCQVELHAGDAGTILATVMLFLHHQVQFFQAIKRGSVFGEVILERLEKPDQGNTALVFDGFAHRNFDAMSKGRKIKKTEDRRQKSEDRSQKSEDRSQKANFSDSYFIINKQFNDINPLRPGR